MQDAFAKTCFDLIEEYAPGFSSSIIGYDMLTPPDLERVLGLTGTFLPMSSRASTFVVASTLYSEHGYDFETFSNCSGVLLFHKVLRRIVSFVTSHSVL